MDEKSSSFFLSLVPVLVSFGAISDGIGAIFQGMSRDIWTLIFWRCLTGLFAGSPIVTQA